MGCHKQTQTTQYNKQNKQGKRGTKQPQTKQTRRKPNKERKKVSKHNKTIKSQHKRIERTREGVNNAYHVLYNTRALFPLVVFTSHFFTPFLNFGLLLLSFFHFFPLLSYFSVVSGTNTLHYLLPSLSLLSILSSLLIPLPI